MNTNPLKNLADFASFPIELEAIYATAPVGLCVLDTQFRFIRINQLLADINGLPVEEHLGKKVREVLPKLADFFEALFQEIISTGAPRLNVEVSGETPAQPGVVRHWNEHWLPIKNDAGDVIAINIVAEEVTERKRFAEALKQSQERFRVAFETAHDAMALSNPTGIVIAANNAYLQLYGYTAEEIIGHSFEVIFPEEEREQALEQYLRVFAGQLELPVYETTVKRKDGTERIVEARTGFVIQNDQRTAMLSVIRDLTERRHTEASLAARYKLTEALSQGVSLQAMARVTVEHLTEVLGAQSGYLYLYHAARNVFELLYTNSSVSPEQLAPWRSFVADPALPITDVVKQNTPLWFVSGEERTAAYPAISEFWHSYPGASILLPLDVNGDIFGALAFVFSEHEMFSEEKQAQIVSFAAQCAQALERARLYEQARDAATLEERQRLARELHDAVSQSLSAATYMAESGLRIWDKKPERALELFNQAVQFNHTAHSELRTLLWELRPEAILKTKPDELLQQLVQTADGRNGMGVELICEGDDQPLPEAVQVALYRVAQESIHNIIKHSQSSQVKVQFHQTPHAFTLRIMDDGRGFDTRREFAGFGMSTMRERAAAIGATLTITSELGKGTRIDLSWNIGSVAI